MDDLASLEGLFADLDVDGDGRLSRADLRAGAERLKWYWRQAPLYAVLDRFIVEAPLGSEAFVNGLQLVLRDPRAAFGFVLEELSLPERPPDLDDGDRAAYLFIDLQRSFTAGTWMASMGHDGLSQVRPIAAAFDAAADFLQSNAGRVETVFTRCPFPPGSYRWDDRVADLIGEGERYFIKPGNSVLWPPTNGFAAWCRRLLEGGTTGLVIGGCTLNSCVRVSAIDVQNELGPEGLQVEVDLSLCGARADNYLPSPLFGGLSPVESAIEQMKDVGVVVRGTPKKPKASRQIT